MKPIIKKKNPIGFALQHAKGKGKGKGKGILLSLSKKCGDKTQLSEKYTLQIQYKGSE
jgi:hypothetical protein